VFVQKVITPFPQGEIAPQPLLPQNNTMTKPHQTYLDTRPTPPEYLTSSAELRYTLTDTLQTLLQQTNHTLITPPKITPNPETFLNSLKTHPKIYQASLSRQFAADLPPDIEQTTLKDEPKDWYIKTADFGDECDRVLQHRDGEYTQLLEDIQEYHQILQQGCDRIIVLRPPNYGAYNTLINAAMQCLGYSLNQFQYIIIQPIKLYAFHQPTQKIHPIPDLIPEELVKAIGMDALRWHSFHVPLTGIAPINITTAGQPTPTDSLYRVQSTHARCCILLYQAHQQGIIQLNPANNWQMTPKPLSLSELTWEDANATTLANQIQATAKVLEQSASEIAPHLVCQHLEAICDSCDRWLKSLSLNPQNCTLLWATKQTIFDLLENILGIKAPEPVPTK